MSEMFMNTKEIAQYLGVHEKQIYALVKEGRIPATRVTGKWLFPRRLIDEWIEENARAGLKEAKKKVDNIKGGILAAGSNDPILDILFTFLRASHPDLYLFTATVGSTDGLIALAKGYTDIAWSHLFDVSTGGYNTPEVLNPILSGLSLVVVNLFWRDVSLILPKGNPSEVKGLEDAIEKRLTFVNRQKGSGTRLYLDTFLDNMGITPTHVPGYEAEVFTHFEVGLAILSGRAQVGIATSDIARMLKLDAIHLTKERFDMVLPKATFFHPTIQTLLEILRSPRFHDLVSTFEGYDFSETGRIMWATP
ncbi:MAG: helix-turn-helix transcriptional regulator [Syntrophales bacterium]|nr:helix-turn-helix transcriptional regulator [Syntrophales bacterium]